MDNGGEPDIVVSAQDNKIMWHKNFNGDFTVEQRKLIPKSLEYLHCSQVCDYIDNKIVSFKNQGNGQFAEENNVNQYAIRSLP
jgi:hypothetical protein